MIDHLGRLNSFLRGEMSAVETYRQALRNVGDIAALTQLEQCCQSHERRVDLLSARIIQLGGKPVADSGAWGALVTTVEGGAQLFGDLAAIDVLIEGESHGLKDYQSHLAELDGDSRYFVERELIPAQVQTHFAVSTLKHAAH